MHFWHIKPLTHRTQFLLIGVKTKSIAWRAFRFLGLACLLGIYNPALCFDHDYHITGVACVVHLPILHLPSILYAKTDSTCNSSKHAWLQLSAVLDYVSATIDFGMHVHFPLFFKCVLNHTKVYTVTQMYDCIHSQRYGAVLFVIRVLLVLFGAWALHCCVAFIKSIAIEYCRSPRLLFLHLVCSPFWVVTCLQFLVLIGSWNSRGWKTFLRMMTVSMLTFINQLCSLDLCC